jgi:SpoVK/Ycf46/Vps4 family AAA+-type ATPase
MPQTRKTRAPVYVSLSEQRIRQIEELVEGWGTEIRRFVLRRLHQHDPSRSLSQRFGRMVQRLFRPQRRDFSFLRDPRKLNDWHHRFEVAGSQDASATWNRILTKELDPEDFHYLSYLLERQTIDTFVPLEIRDIFETLYHSYILKKYSEDPKVPRAPLILVIGNSGSGKSATVKQAIEEVFFASEVKPVIDLKAKREEIMANQPIWRSLEDVDPELAMRIERRSKRTRLRFFSRLPIVRYFFRNIISAALSTLDEAGILIDYAEITPNDYQTAWAGEPGNYLLKAMGHPRKPTVRHIEEAHSAFGRPDQLSSVKSQQSSLVDTANIILDEIIHGQRDCILIATTDQPEQLDPAIYRRFVERGLVVDLNEFWEKPENLRQVVCLELRRKMHPPQPETPDTEHLSEEELTRAIDKLYPIFRQRSLRITPAYVRRLTSEVINLHGRFNAKCLDDPLLVRDALKSVARNTYGALYKRLVGQMDRNITWQEYIGGIKNEFSEMANNALFYNVSEEKGVVLTGPPGSGKTFMVRAWLGDNHDVQDISVNLADLNDPMRPLEGMVANLEAVYDIAKMISPSMVFFDEGDAVAPRRTPQGGSPYDKVTNKFLSLIDGEAPLNRVFTVLTTNRLDILDPALIRSKRLKVLNVTGHLRDEDGQRIIIKEMGDLPLEEGLTSEEITRQARTLCETPADFTAFAEKVRTLRKTEIEVTDELLRVAEENHDEKIRFVRFNYKILLGLLEGLAPNSSLLQKARQGEDALLSRLEEVIERMRRLKAEKNFPISSWHLQNARQQLAASPLRKGKQQLDEFLETELSQEPQIGFVVGVGANETSGVILPIASSLVYRIHPQKILITGAVSSAAAGAAELDLAVQMTNQSASEALTLVQNYLGSLVPELNLAKVLGDFLEGYSLHHQLLSASYNVGGPSAGFALAINTLSVLLQLPVLNDFGITGAPWIKGAHKGEVGASVLIGGHLKKTEKVLQYLQRMYMPQQNYLDMEPEVLDAYRAMGKDVIGVRSFSNLVPEVFDFGQDHLQQLQDFFARRRELSRPASNQEALPAAREELERTAAELRSRSEAILVERIGNIEKSLKQPKRNYADLSGLFRQLT